MLKGSNTTTLLRPNGTKNILPLLPNKPTENFQPGNSSKGWPSAMSFDSPEVVLYCKIDVAVPGTPYIIPSVANTLLPHHLQGCKFLKSSPRTSTVESEDRSSFNICEAAVRIA